MQMFLGEMKVKSVNLHTDSDDATLVASDMQTGVTGYAKGQKVTGTGKAFAFAFYGSCPSNKTIPLPLSAINTIVIAAAGNAIKMANTALELRGMDFSTKKQVATITVNGTDYPVNIQITNNSLTVSCDQDVTLQVMFGKDEHI